MLARLRAWKAKEVQERAQQKNLFFIVPSTFMGRELAPYGPFFFAFQPIFFISFPVWPLLPKIYDDTGLGKLRYTMRKNFHLVSLRAQKNLSKRAKVGLRNFQNQI